MHACLHTCMPAYLPATPQYHSSSSPAPAWAPPPSLARQGLTPPPSPSPSPPPPPAGKSAALGLSIAGALALGYSNIFVTAPSPENLRTLFEFVFKGLDALEYKEHIDYDLVESSNPAWGKAVVRINVFRWVVVEG
jgi:hypothetical protein